MEKRKWSHFEDENGNKSQTASIDGYNIADRLLEGVISTDGVIADPTTIATTTVFRTNLTNVDNFYKDNLLVFITGALMGQAKPIKGYLQTNGEITLDEALTSIPSHQDEFIILSEHIHPISQIATSIRNELSVELQHLVDLAKDHGLVIGFPVTITPTGITVGTIVRTIAGDQNSRVVTRTS